MKKEFSIYDNKLFARDNFEINIKRLLEQKGITDTFTINDILGLKIPFSNKFIFVNDNCELTNEEHRKIALSVAKIVLPVFEKYYSDNICKKALKVADKYLNDTLIGDLNTEIKLVKKSLILTMDNIARDIFANDYAEQALDSIYCAFTCLFQNDEIDIILSSQYAIAGAYHAAYDSPEIMRELIKYFKTIVK